MREEEVNEIMKKGYIKTLFAGVICAVALTTISMPDSTVSAEPSAVQTQAVTTSAQETPNPLSVVNSPKLYLNKKIVMTAKFDKFSTLGLDYKPALKSSDDYISFLIKRNDTKYDIPLSEMKLFLKRDYAEKFIDLKSNDEIKITGTVFSDALGDAWVDVENITILNKAPEKDGVK